MSTTLSAVEEVAIEPTDIQLTETTAAYWECTFVTGPASERCLGVNGINKISCWKCLRQRMAGCYALDNSRNRVGRFADAVTSWRCTEPGLRQPDRGPPECIGINPIQETTCRQCQRKRDILCFALDKDGTEIGTFMYEDHVCIWPPEPDHDEPEPVVAESSVRH
ncbi:hypothetical protein HJFPF1_11550 [Paramyrothecium foliicola]|nr:hypothetical protein HJFPF1_11550 [Paramyrothecium foliicola]